MLITFRSLSLDSVFSLLDPFSGKLSHWSLERREILGLKNKSQTCENLSQATYSLPSTFSLTFTRTVDCTE